MKIKRIVFSVLSCIALLASSIPTVVFAATQSESLTIAVFGGNTQLFANGIPITVTYDSDQNVNVVTCEDGSSVTIPAGSNVFGGSHNSSVTLDSTNVTVDGGKLRNVFGGGLHKSHVVNANVTIKNNSSLMGVHGGGASSFAHDGEAGCEYSSPWYSGDAKQSPCIVDNAVVIIESIDTSSYAYGLIYGGGEGISYTGKATLTIKDGNLSNSYITAGGSNGYTGEAVLNIEGGNLGVVQSVNRGSMESAAINVSGENTVIKNLYIGGETGDSSVTGTISQSNVLIESGTIENLAPGTNGGVEIQTSKTDDMHTVTIGDKANVTLDSTLESSDPIIKKAVAKIGDNAYTSIQEAVDAVANGTETAGSTITLVRDVTENIKIPAETNIILDLNEFTLSHDTDTTTPTPYCVDNGGTLKIVNGNIESTHASTSCVRNDVGGNLTLEGVTVSSAFVSVKNENDANLTINNCDISTTYAQANTGALLNWGNAEVSDSAISGGSSAPAIYATSGADGGANSSITLTNCDISGKYAVYAKKYTTTDTTTQTVIINGGSLSSVSTGVYADKSSTMTIEGNVKANTSALSTVLGKCVNGTTVTLSEDLTNRTITVPEGITLVVPDGITYTIGKTQALTVNGELVVKEGGELVGAVAYNKTNNTYYSTVTRAISLSNSSDGTSYIVLMEDTTEDVSNKVTAKNINLDLNGKTLTGDITFSGGTLVIDDSTENPGLVKGTLTAGEDASLTTVGGRYSDANVSGYIPEGSEKVQDPDGNYSIHTHITAKTEAVQATCTTAGNIEYWYCSDCGKYFSDEKGTTEIADANNDGVIDINDTVVAATGHNMTHHARVEATCTKAGNIEYWYCETEKKYFSDANGNTEITLAQTVIAATGHKMTHHARVEATCTKAGNIEYWYCETEKKYFSDANGNTEITLAQTVIPAAGHKMTHHERVEATCTTDGNIEYWYCDTEQKYFSDENGENEITLADTVISAAGHNMTHFDRVEATCTTDGNIEYWYCETEQKYFSDENGENEITLDDTVISATGHNMTHFERVEATCTTDGNIEYWYCETEQKYFSDENGENEIALADTIILATGHKYENGVCTVCGEKDPDYVAPTSPVTKPSTHPTAQPTTALKPTIEAPKQAKLTKLRVRGKIKKAITVKWRKVKGAKGYEVEVSKSKKFKAGKKVLTKNTKKLKLVIKNKNLKSGKTYYVRVRAYTTYKDENGKSVKVYSKWNYVLRKAKIK